MDTIEQIEDFASTTSCPAWCTDHWPADGPVDAMHRWVAPVDPAASYRGDASVSITQGMLPREEPTLSWNGEEHDTSPAGARRFAAALLVAATKLDEIHGSAMTLPELFLIATALGTRASKLVL
jgi:hypothetical protein